MKHEPPDLSRGIRRTKRAEDRDLIAPCRQAEAREMLDERDWYIAIVSPQSEFRVVHDLHLRGVFALTPTATIYRRANRATKHSRIKTYPAAPGYVIFAMDRGFPKWVNVFECPNVSGVVSDGNLPIRLRRRPAITDQINRPHPLPPIMPRPAGPHPVEQILDRIVHVAPEAAKYMRAKQEFSVGDTVRVCEESFDGIDVTVTGIDVDEVMATVLLNVFGAAREVRVNLRLLAKAA